MSALSQTNADRSGKLTCLLPSWVLLLPPVDSRKPSRGGQQDECRWGLSPERTCAEPWRWFGQSRQRSDTLWRHGNGVTFYLCWQGKRERERERNWSRLVRHVPGHFQARRWWKKFPLKFSLICVKVKSLFSLADKADWHLAVPSICHCLKRS